MYNNLIIAGVHKAASTSLFSYLMDHPKICASTKKEIHHYTPLRYGNDTKSLDTYNSFFSHCSNDSKYLLEASPSYLYGTKNIGDRMSSELNNPKLIFILRDPLSRFISYYKHCEGKFLIPKNTSFNSFYNQNRSNFDIKDIDDPFHRGLREGIYVDYVPYWINEFKGEVKIVFFEDLIANPKNVLSSLCKWLDIADTCYENYDFKVENKTFRHKNGFLSNVAKKINKKFEYFLRSNKHLRAFLKNIYASINTDSEVQIDDFTKNQVNEFYKRYNTELSELLSKNGCKDLPIWLKK